MRRRVWEWRPSAGLLVAVVALFAAIAGTALAGPGATTSKLTKKKVVKIADQEINKLAPGLSVAHADSANTAGSANTADSANTAGNADQVDGQDASDFAPAGEVHSPARVVMNDATPGDGSSTIATLVTAGSFTVKGQCFQNLGGGSADQASMVVEAPSESSVVSERDGVVLNLTSTDVGSVASASTSGSAGASGGHLIAVAPNGQVLHVNGSAEVNDAAGDCVFGVTAIGP